MRRRPRGPGTPNSKPVGATASVLIVLGAAIMQYWWLILLIIVFYIVFNCVFKM